VTSIAMYFLWTGVNRPTIHVPLSKWCMGSFASIALTGLIMMYQVLM
jgi:hypothetical protein